MSTPSRLLRQELPSAAPRVVQRRGREVAMEVLVERCAGIDVHQAQVRVCVRMPAAGGRRKRVEEFASFGTTTPDLLVLADWLTAQGVTQVAMEGTGVYWKPVYYVLEAGFELWLVNAQHVKNVALV